MAKRTTSAPASSPMTQGEIIAAIREAYPGATFVSFIVERDDARVQADYGPRTKNSAGMVSAIGE